MVIRVTVEKGTVELPDELRDRFGIEDGTVLLAEAGADGIVLRPDDARSENEFFLNNATDLDEYRWARAEVERMGLNPDDIPHEPIGG